MQHLLAHPSHKQKKGDDKQGGESEECRTHVKMYRKRNGIVAEVFLEKQMHPINIAEVGLVWSATAKGKSFVREKP